MPTAVPSGMAGKRAPFVPPKPSELASAFPQLEIIELIGQGGMGAVYRARQPSLDRIVALKILPPQTERDPGFNERFQREARALAKLSHPNIVAVHDFGESGGYPYFVMEFVDGLTLRQLLAAGKVEPATALTIVPAICDALQYAHDRGIVHRDIKPENILLDKRGAVKIADFGLAKLMDAPTPDLAITGARDVMGTPHYMAPEQVERPREVDHRADIYSLGVVFYQMLTGELPLGRFAAPSRKVTVDVRLDEVVLRALEKEPQLRFQQASVLKTEVETIAASPGAPARADDDEIDREIRLPATFLAVMQAVNLIGVVGRAGFLIAVSEGRQMGLFLVSLLPLVAAIAFALWGALQMRQRQRYKAATLAAAVSIVTPFLPSLGSLMMSWSSDRFFFALLGLWAVVVLQRTEVRERFAAVAGTASGLRESWHKLAFGALAVAVAIYGVPLGIHFVVLTEAAPEISPQPAPAESTQPSPAPEERSPKSSAAVGRPTPDATATARNGTTPTQAPSSASNSPVAIPLSAVEFSPPAPPTSARRAPLPTFDSLDVSPDILQLQIQQAEAQIAATQQRYNVGLATPTDVADVADLAALLHARMADDRVRFAQIRVKAAERRVEQATAFFNNGLLRRADLDEANSALALEKARLNEEETRSAVGRKSNTAAGSHGTTPPTPAAAAPSGATRWPPLPGYDSFDNNPEVLSLLLKQAESLYAETKARNQIGLVATMDVEQAAANVSLLQARLAGDRVRFAQILVEVGEKRVREATARVHSGLLSADELAVLQTVLDVDRVRLKEEEAHRPAGNIPPTTPEKK